MQEKQTTSFSFAASRRRYSPRCCSWIFFFLLLASVATGFSPSSTRSLAAAVAPPIFAANTDSMTDVSPSPKDPITPAADKSNSNHENHKSEPDSSENNDDNTFDMRFGRFVIPEASVFCRSARAAAFVNLRPIVEGHVLVVPRTIVPQMSDLGDEDYAALWTMVRTVQSTLRKAYPGTTAFNVAVQDGRAAGQSVPHVHVHVLPRSGGDFERNDDVYDALEAWAPTEAMAASKPSTDMAVPDDADRVDRTAEQMADEAAMYRRLLEE